MTDQLTALRDLRTDVARSIDKFTSPAPDKVEASLDELMDTVTGWIDPDVKAVCYAVRPALGAVFVVTKMDDGEMYSLIRLFSVGGKWKAYTEVQFGGVDAVLEFLMNGLYQ